MPKSKGFKHSTRKLFTKKPRERGIQPLGRLLSKYEVGDRVLIKIDPAVHKGMPHRRYHGKVGEITEVRGRAYVVKVKAGNKFKQIITRPEHVYLVKEGKVVKK